MERQGQMQRSGTIGWDWKAAKSRTEAEAIEQQRDDDAKFRVLRFCEKERAKSFFLQLWS